MNEEASDFIHGDLVSVMEARTKPACVSGYNERHPGPQQVLHCCMGPGII